MTPMVVVYFVTLSRGSRSTVSSSSRLHLSSIPSFLFNQRHSDSMDRNDIPALKAQVKNVVRQADARGDIDAGRFTLKVAKKEIGSSHPHHLGLESY